LADVIDYRQLIMKQLDAQSDAFGMIVSGQIPPDSQALEAKSIAKADLKAFEPNVLGGEAKPEVWSRRDGSPSECKRSRATARRWRRWPKPATLPG
jgi:cytochrome c556